MFLSLMRNLTLLGLFCYLFYQTLFDHYIIWTIGILTWLFVPGKRNLETVQTPRYSETLRAKIRQNARAPNVLALTLQNMAQKHKTFVNEPLNNEDLREASEYMVELSRVQRSGIQSPKLKELLDAEIHLCSKKMKFSTLKMERQKILEQLLKVQESLRTTSRQVFREQLQKELSVLQDKLDSVSTELMKAELSQAEVKENLIQCKETVESVIDKLSEVEVSPANSGDESEGSDSPAMPWLKLCEASTGLDSHCSNLPTTTIEKFDWNQSDKFVKLYLDVPGLKETDHAKVSTTFGERHISVFVAGVDSHNYKFIVQELGDAIDINESKFRLKEERIVLFLKKKQQIRWTDLTAKAAAGRKQSVERLLNKMQVVFTEFVGLTALVENLPEELRTRMLMESGCLVVDNTAHTAHVLELVQANAPEPPKLVLFRMRLSQPFPDEDFIKALKALADLECYISLQNAQFEYSSDVEEDDQFVRLLLNKPCTLVSFCGRLSRECFSVLPAALLELKLFISSAEELNALIETIITVNTLHVRVKTDMDLKNVKNFDRRALLTPLCLVFYGIEDSNVDWLLEALRKILPLSNVQDMNPFLVCAWSLELLACRLTCAAHKRLLSQLPMDPTSVTIHDTTGDPELADLATSYPSRFCKFDLRPMKPSSAVAK